MAFEDKQLTCKDCGRTFVWTVSEQEFYKEKGFEHAPVRCPEDRAKKKARMGESQKRALYEITCASCGRKDTVPFQPKDGRPVFCRDCFKRQQQSSQS